MTRTFVLSLVLCSCLNRDGCEVEDHARQVLPCYGVACVEQDQVGGGWLCLCDDREVDHPLVVYCPPRESLPCRPVGPAHDAGPLPAERP